MAPQRWSTSTGADIDRYQYAYDDVGNPTIRANLLNDKLTETYGYDSLNQLVGYVRKDAIPSPSRVQTQSWQFDALGNWTTAWTGSTPQPRVTNAQNEITSVGATALTHDANGNLTTDEAGHKLVYDAWNRLHMVATVNGKPVAIYAYDALGRRVSEFLNASSPAETRHCYYSDQWQVIEERVQTTARSTTGRLNAQYVWSPVQVDAMIERDRDSNGDAILDERVYALQDANWNVTALVAGPGVSGYAVGAIINRFAYTPYGTTQVMTPSWTAAPSTAIPWKHTFQGLAGNTFTGLYDARNRDYSPTLGRFIEPDPIGFQAGDNNFYRFVGNGPVGRTDAMGLYVDIAVEIVSIGTGLHSFGMNVWAGQWTAAGVDAVGIVIDVGLSVVPGAPGATGLAIKTGREAAELTGRRFVGREAAEQATRIVGNAAEQSAKKDATKGVVSNGFRSSCEADVGDASQFGVRAKGSGSGPHDATSPRTGKWGRGSFGSASESLVEHFATHGAEVGAKDIDQYLRKAEAFAQNLRGATKSAVDGATPGTTRYKKLGKYIDIDRNGHIISFGGQ